MKPQYLILGILVLASAGICWQSNLEIGLETVPCSSDHCVDCDITQTNCTRCDTGFVLKEKATECLSCDSQINACQLCTIDLNEDVTCDECVLPLVPTNNAKECKTCEEQITHCTLCGKRDKKFDPIYCDECQAGLIPTTSGQACLSCKDQIPNCLQCNDRTERFVRLTCAVCAENYLPTDNYQECLTCSQQIPHCQECLTRPQPKSPLQCDVCMEGYELDKDHRCVEKESNASTIIIVTAIVGGLVLIGVGFAIFKCMRKKKGVSRLLEEDYQE